MGPQVWTSWAGWRRLAARPKFGCFILDGEPAVRAFLRKRNRRFAAGALVAAVAAGHARAEDAQPSFDITEAIARGRFTLELRPRYNRIEESDYPELTRGGTMRALAGWRSAPYRDLRFTIEAIHTDH